MAGAKARRIKSITVGSVRLQFPTGAGGSALKIFPGGMIIFNGRKHPSSMAERSEEHTSELQSRRDLVCRLLLEKKKKQKKKKQTNHEYTILNNENKLVNKIK